MDHRGTGNPLRRFVRAAWRAVLRSVALTLWLFPVAAFAAGGGKPATKIYNVADTRAMSAGLSKWIADIYNNNLWLYGTTVVVIMAAMGLILGYGMDRLLVLLGINLGKLEHHE